MENEFPALRESPKVDHLEVRRRFIYGKENLLSTR